MGPIGPARGGGGGPSGPGYPPPGDSMQRGPLPPFAPPMDPHYHGMPPYPPAAAVPSMTPMSLPTQPSQSTDAQRAGDMVAGMADLELSQRTPLDFGDGAESQPFIGDFKSQDESQLSQEPGSMDDYLKTQNLPFTQ